MSSETQKTESPLATMERCLEDSSRSIDDSPNTRSSSRSESRSRSSSELDIETNGSALLAVQVSPVGNCADVIGCGDESSSASSPACVATSSESMTTVADSLILCGSSKIAGNKNLVGRSSPVHHLSLSHHHQILDDSSAVSPTAAASAGGLMGSRLNLNPHHVSHLYTIEAILGLNNQHSKGIITSVK